MGKRIEYKEGQILGDYGIEFVRNVPTNKDKQRRAKFKCHCGRIFENTVVAIKRNHIKSCGCIFKINSNYREGQPIGDNGIKFVKYYESRSKDRKAVFRCHCGQEFINYITKIKNNYVKSCGCILGKNGLKEYESGQKIGSNGFVFIKWTGDKIGNERSAWVKCRCGKKYIATASRIVNDYTKSCGCTNGKEKWIKYKEGDILGNYGIRYIRDAGKNKYNQRQAVFKCWCGNEFTAGVNTIKCKAQKGCGNHEVWNRIEYEEGQLIGSNGIKFIKEAGRNNHNQREALFKCSCGKEFITEINNIKTNRQRSCGCANDEPSPCRIEYKKGQMLGDYGISFIKDVESESERRLALMKCSCGKEFITVIQRVKSNTTASCGCASKSLGEDKIAAILKLKSIEFYQEYREDECKDRVSLPFDFAIKKDSNVLSFIEYDGLHHFEPIAFFGGEKHFLYTKKHDQIKNRYCESNHIPLLRIPYTEFNNIENIVSDFLTTISIQ